MTRAILLLILLIGAPAAAQRSSKPDAQAHLERAKRHFELQEYEAAENALKEAYRIDPKPEILYAIAQTQRRRGDCAAAMTSYQNFLRTNPKPDQAKLAASHVAACEAELEAARKKAAERPVTSPPTRVVIREAPPPRPDGVRWTRNWLGHGLVAAGAITAMGGAIVALGGQARIDELNGSQFYDDFLVRSRDIASAESTRTTGFVLVGGGTALLVAGIVTYIVRSPSRESRTAITIDRRGARIGWAW